MVPGINIDAAIGHDQRSWISAIRRYIAFIAIANLIWEFAQLPLYTLWLTATPKRMAFAAIHCTGGDVLIALASLMLALSIIGPVRWPREGYWRVLALTLLFGIGYSIFSEWLNIEVRQSWDYRDLMPIVPVINTGLSPLLQWIIIPVAANFWGFRRLPKPSPDRGLSDV